MADDKVINQEGSADAEQLQARVVELESLIAQRDEELAQAQVRLAEMGKTADKSNQVLTQAVASYKALVIKANLGIPEELITGNTVDEVNASVARANALVAKVKQGLTAEMASARVPAGAPARTTVNLEALTPREKIQYAIGGKR